MKSWLELKVKKMKIMASVLITSWRIEGEKVEAVIDFIFLGSKSLWMIWSYHGVATCSYYEIKRGLLLGRKAMTKKLRHFFADKGL